MRGEARSEGELAQGSARLLARRAGARHARRGCSREGGNRGGGCPSPRAGAAGRPQPGCSAALLDYRPPCAARGQDRDRTRTRPGSSTTMKGGSSSRSALRKARTNSSTSSGSRSPGRIRMRPTHGSPVATRADRSPCRGSGRLAHRRMPPREARRRAGRAVRAHGRARRRSPVRGGLQRFSGRCSRRRGVGGQRVARSGERVGIR